jgi:hypothetical protein
VDLSVAGTVERVLRDDPAFAARHHMSSMPHDVKSRTS